MARDNALRFTFSTVNVNYTNITLALNGIHTAVAPAVAPPNGTVLIFSSVGGATGISTATPYYVVNSSGATFSLAYTLNGAPFALTLAGASAAAVVQNANPVSTALGGRSGATKLVSTVNQYFTAFSDALNVTRFRTQVADISLITSQAVVSGIVNDSPLQSSTSEGNYYLRTSVQPAGMFGPSPCQIIVQGAGVNSPTAPVPGDIDWLQVSNVGSCPANCTIAVLNVTDTTGTHTVLSGSVAVGNTISPVATAAGLNIGQHYVVGPGGKILTTNGLNATTTAAALPVYVGNFGQLQSFSTASSVAGAPNILLDVLPQSGCIVVFTALTGATGLSVNTPYYVLPSPVVGQIQLSATYNGAAITSSTAITAGAGYCTNVASHPYVYVSNTVTSNVLQAVAVQGGTLAAPHGLEVGDVIYAASGTPGTIALDVPYYVNTVPSATTFTLSTTINGATTTVTNGTNLNFAVSRASKIVNAQIDKTIRPWMRVAAVNQNTAYAQVGYLTFNFADICTGRDNSLVN